ncbi:hypothetical protein ACVWZZ_003481 [Bradyrhizobium sp. LM6.10]
MKQRTQYDVTLRNAQGEQHTRRIFAEDEAAAQTRAIEKARVALGETMVERRYGSFQLVSCVRA